MTIKLAVFGNPIAHSLSPLIHNFFASELKLDISYDKIQAGDNFKELCLDFLKNARGCNITVPFKEEAYTLASALSERARIAGACNTLKKNEDGSIFGDNTDGVGLVLDLKSLGLELKDKNVLIIGAGGAARGIINELYKEEPKTLYLTNRTYTKALDLASAFSCLKILSEEALRDANLVFDVIINASSASLCQKLPDIEDSLLSRASFVYDLMYTKEGSTIFTDHAKKLGVDKAFDGLGMLIGQAAFAFYLWTGQMPDINKARAYMRDYLNKKHD